MERKPEQGQAKRLLWGWEGTVTFSTLKVVVWGGGLGAWLVLTALLLVWRKAASSSSSPLTCCPGQMGDGDVLALPYLCTSPLGRMGPSSWGWDFLWDSWGGPWMSPKELLGSPQWSLGPKISPGRGSQRGFSHVPGLEEHHQPCPQCGAGSQRGACSSSSLCAPHPLARAMCHPCSPGAGDGAARDAQSTLWPWLPVIYAPGRRPGPESAAWPPALGWE